MSGQSIVSCHQSSEAFSYDFSFCSVQFDTSTFEKNEEVLPTSPTTHSPPCAQRNTELFFDVAWNVDGESCVFLYLFSGSRTLSFCCSQTRDFHPTISPKNRLQQPCGCSAWCRRNISPLAALNIKGTIVALPPSAMLGASCDLC